MDLGTTNTAVARWDPVQDRPDFVTLPEICRRPSSHDPLEAPRLIPSATHVCPETGWKTRMGAWPLLTRHVFWGRRAWIGRTALERNVGGPASAYAPTFKPYLGRESMRPLARVGRRVYTARDVAALFIRELLAEVKRATGERIRDLVITTPVDSYETYRAELIRIARRLGIRRLRFLDEPVAAALGYDLSMERDRHTLVLDFGGGTMHLVLAALGAREVEAGSCRVVAKEGSWTGGELVDRWVLEELCRRLDCPLPDEPDHPNSRFWTNLMLAEACRVKESLFFNQEETFWLTLPDRLKPLRPGVDEGEISLEVSREDLRGILRQRGLYEHLDESLDHLLATAAAEGIRQDSIQDVLMVGGSSLLPDVYGLFENRFGRDRVRAWQPFEAVAYGAAAFAGGRFNQSDYIVHDYAFMTYHPETHQPQYTVIIPRGTRFPTRPDLWRRQLTPTCSLGEPEAVFKLVVCEIGRAGSGERRFSWDADGQLRKLGGENPGGTENLIVPLNESNPTLGRLEPPHQPGDRRPRLEIAFGVNQDRWLCTTVRDLQTAKVLLQEEPVVRLL